MKKLLLIGDYDNAQWHSLKETDVELKRIFVGFDVEILEDYPSLTPARLQEYDTVVTYWDAWDKRGDKELAGIFIGYVAGGGSLLVIHNGIITHSSPELEQMAGGAFTEHPEMETLEYVPVGEHPISQGLEAFSLKEEPYRHQMDNLARVTIFMEYIHNGDRYPAAWLRGFGKGKVCYVSIGHEPASFRHAGTEKLLQKSAQWCAGLI